MYLDPSALSHDWLHSCDSAFNEQYASAQAGIKPPRAHFTRLFSRARARPARAAHLGFHFCESPLSSMDSQILLGAQEDGAAVADDGLNIDLEYAEDICWV